MTLTTILIITNVLTLIALIYLLIANTQTNGNNIVIDPQTLGFTDTYTMSAETAFNLITNYTNNHLPLIDDNSRPNSLLTRRSQGFESDSRSIWFPVNQMLRFLLDMKAQAATTCGSSINTELMGVRLYYAEYPSYNDEWWNSQAAKSPVDGSSLQQYAGMHTIVMVPTYRNTNGKDIDFDPTNMNNSTTDGPFAMKQVVSSGAMAMMLNHGTMCPPPFPGSSNSFYQDYGAYFLDPQ